MPRGRWRFSNFYKWAGVLHRDIGSMSLWEWACATEGYSEANGGKKARGGDISEDRLADMGIAGF